MINRKHWSWPEDKPKPKLRAIILPHYRVHYTDLEKYLATVYRMHEFSFLKATRFAPGEIPEYLVSGTLRSSTARADQIRSGRWTVDIGLVLNVLCLDGFIPPGQYIIDTKPKDTAIEQYRALLSEHGSPLTEECIRFRKQHQKDPGFKKRADQLTRALLDSE